MHSRPSSAQLTVVCLCAEWCGSCREYRATFDDVARHFPDAAFRWIDIEDEADLVDPVEVENFPTLLIADGDAPLFFGPVMPHRETLLRLVRTHADADTTKLPMSPDVHELLSRLRG
jgi:thioredoxin 1